MVHHAFCGRNKLHFMPADYMTKRSFLISEIKIRSVFYTEKFRSNYFMAQENTQRPHYERKITYYTRTQDHKRGNLD